LGERPCEGGGHAAEFAGNIPRPGDRVIRKQGGKGMILGLVIPLSSCPLVQIGI
jgi:hypothetical protein